MKSFLDYLVAFIRINIIKNWKTTLTGLVIAYISYKVITAQITVEVGTATLGFLTALGLIYSKDGNKTGV